MVEERFSGKMLRIQLRFFLALVLVLFGATHLLFLTAKAQLGYEFLRATLILFILSLLIRTYNMVRVKMVGSLDWMDLLDPNRFVQLLFLAVFSLYAIDAYGFKARYLTVSIKAFFFIASIFLLYSRRSVFERGFAALLTALLPPLSPAFLTMAGIYIPAFLVLYSLYLATLLLEEKSMPKVDLLSGGWIWPLVAYIIYYAINPLFSEDFSDSFLHVQYLLVYTLLLGLGVLYFGKDENRGRLLDYIIYPGIFYLVIVLLHFAGGVLGASWGWDPGKIQKQGNIITTHLGLHFMFFTAALLLKWSRARSLAANFTIVFFPAAMSFLTLNLLLARGSIIGLFAGGILFLLFLIWKPTIRIWIPVILLSFLAIAAFVFSRKLIFHHTSSLHVRFLLWDLGWFQFVKHPLLGYGTFLNFDLFRSLGSPQLHDELAQMGKVLDPWTDAHSAYLSILLQGGLLGLLLFGILIGAAFQVIGNQVRKGEADQRVFTLLYIIPLVAMLVVGSVESIMVNHMARNWFWVFMLLIFSGPGSRSPGDSLRKEESKFLPGPTVRLLAIGLLMVSFIYIEIGNILVNRSVVLLSSIQTQLREIITLDRIRTVPEGEGISPEKKLEDAARLLSLAGYFDPMNGTVKQLAGEVDLFQARQAVNGEGRDRLLRRAIGSYEEAIARRPNYAVYYLRLADIYGLARTADPRIEEGLDQKIKIAMERAETLDPYGVHRYYYNR